VYKVLVLSKKDKLLKFIKNNPTNVKFEDLKKVLENIGYKVVNRGGSHYVFTKKDGVSLCIPYKKPVKVIYVKQVIKIIEEEENER
jgi:predicted RNA binding protein YcfA (HicA-like mRNA interferase family)